MQIFTQCFILFDHMSMHWLTPCGAQASCPAVQQSRRPPWRLSSSAYSTRSKLLLGGFNPCHTSNISSAAGCSAYHIPYKNSYRVYIGYTLHIIIIVHMKSGYIWLRSVILRLSIVSLTGCFLSWRLLMQCINCRRSSSQIEPFGSPTFFVENIISNVFKLAENIAEDVTESLFKHWNTHLQRSLFISLIHVISC